LFDLGFLETLINFTPVTFAWSTVLEIRLMPTELGKLAPRNLLVVLELDPLGVYFETQVAHTLNGLLGLSVR